jgi:hypothetical protein
VEVGDVHVNRGQLKTRVARIVGIGLGTDDDGVAEGALLEELANEAVVDILSRTRVHVREATIPLGRELLRVRDRRLDPPHLGAEKERLGRLHRDPQRGQP